MKDINTVLSGILYSEFVPDHVFEGMQFYRGVVKIYRKSGTADLVPVLTTDVPAIEVGNYIKVFGQFRSRNIKEEDHTKLVLNVMADRIEPGEKFFLNTIELTGVVCKAPRHRTTPLGREITDVLIAVNRDYGKSDYIPLVFWGPMARCAAECYIGQQLNVSGRIQSRSYTKDGVENMAYEVSVSEAE